MREIIILILIFLLIILLLVNVKKKKVINYMVTNSLQYKDSLYWVDLILNNQNFNSMIDTGSNLVVVKGDTCEACTPGSSLPVNRTNPNYLTASYGGGQDIKYIQESIFSPQFGKEIEVSVVKSGSNPQGYVQNILGLLNSSLGLETLTLDFPNMQILFNNSLSRQGTPADLLSIPYLSFAISHYEDINMIILDTGSNFVMSNIPFPDGFRFVVGNMEIVVPPELIKTGQNITPHSVVIGNLILSKYKWEIDFSEKKLWVYQK